MWLLPLLLITTLYSSQDSAVNPFERRARDWRVGALVYQIFVDRFAPSRDLEAKKRILQAPRVLKSWSETPKASRYDPKIGFPHVLEFWGGDLKGIQNRLDYIESLSADVVYLTPIFKAYSNHKYDTEDYMAVSPEFGTRDDLLNLIQEIHRRRMRLMLDGVFNHMGRTSPAFQQALQNPQSPYRNWFAFGRQYPDGYRAWYGIRELPVLRLENPAVRDYLWRSLDSIVRRYLYAGIDGWRLDVAFDLGPKMLAEIRQAAHETKPGSAVIGEINGYPADWFGSVDGVFNFHSMQVVVEMLKGQIPGGRAGRMLERVVADAGLENILRSWLLIDNHDTPRAADILPDIAERRLAQALLLTLPGAPVLYYGSELGMTGAGDPENRAPMRWDLAAETNSELRWMRQLARLRRQRPALRYGDFRVLDTDRLLAFARTTDRLRDTVLIAVNPTAETVKETFSTRVGRILSWGEMEDVFTGKRLPSKTGLLALEMPPRSVLFFVPVTRPNAGYSPYERIP